MTSPTNDHHIGHGLSRSGTDLKDGLGNSQPAALEGAFSGATRGIPSARTKSLWETCNLRASALAIRGGLPGGQPVAGCLWAVRHQVAWVNLLHVL